MTRLLRDFRLICQRRGAHYVIEQVANCKEVLFQHVPKRSLPALLVVRCRVF